MLFEVVRTHTQTPPLIIHDVSLVCTPAWSRHGVSGNECQIGQTLLVLVIEIETAAAPLWHIFLLWIQKHFSQTFLLMQTRCPLWEKVKSMYECALARFAVHSVKCGNNRLSCLSSYQAIAQLSCSGPWAPATLIIIRLKASALASSFNEDQLLFRAKAVAFKFCSIQLFKLNNVYKMQDFHSNTCNAHSISLFHTSVITW